MPSFLKEKSLYIFSKGLLPDQMNIFNPTSSEIRYAREPLATSDSLLYLVFVIRWNLGLFTESWSVND